MHTLRNVENFLGSVVCPWLLGNHTSSLYQDTSIHCKDMVLHTNRVMVGLLFPQLASWDGFNNKNLVEVILPDWESSEVEEKIQNILLLPYEKEKKYIESKQNIENDVEEYKDDDKKDQFVKRKYPEVQEKIQKILLLPFEKEKKYIERKQNNENNVGEYEDDENKDQFVNSEHLELETNTMECLANKANSESKKVFYHCDKCDKRYSHISALNKHKPLHDGSVHCDLCNKTYKSAFNLTRHLHLMHSSKDKKEEYVCEICPSVSKSKNNLYHHMKYVHCSERTYMCSMCEKKFKNKSNLSQHEALHTGNFKSSKCNVCGVIIKGSGKSPMEYHMKSHVKKNNWKCDICGYYFRGQTNLLDHNEIHHTE